MSRVIHRPHRLAPSASLSALVVLLIAVLAPGSPAGAGQNSHGEPVVIINPGGGVQTDGTDGVRMVVNSDGTVADAGWVGQDQLFFLNTYQYCCSAAAPMLNIGGTLYGEAGAAHNQTSWTDLEIVSTSGSTSTSGGTDIGSGTAVIRYTAEHGGLTYLVDRTIGYVYPNNFVAEEYSFTIPAGNTETVKFYQGGDTAPGSSDAGTGVMITTPVRTVFSVNPSSEIQLGYGEMPGEVPFDGALATSYSSPYSVVQAGTDIGFQATTSSHDAGIMIQWTIGDTPGTHRRIMRTYVGERGASLSANPRATTVPVGGTVLLDLAITNTGSDPETGLDYTFELPVGLLLGSQAPTSDCGGSLTAPAGGTTVALTGGSVGAAANCLVTVELAAPTAGAHQFTSSSVSAIVGLDNAVGTSTLHATVEPVLTAGLGAADAEIDQSVALTLTLANSNAIASSGLGFVFELPSGLRLAGTTPSNGCDGTLDAPDAGSVITLTGATASATDSCSISVGVTSSAAGSYQLSSSAVTSATGVSNGVATMTLVVGAADANHCPGLHGWTVIGDQVARLYPSLLGRSVEAPGQLYWTRARLSGLPVEALADLLLASPERLGRTGTLSNEGFVDQLYLDALGRSPETAGRAYWVSRLDAGVSRSAVALAVSDSAEAVASTGTRVAMTDNQALVCRLYRILLERSPEDGGFEHWTMALDRGVSPEAVAATILVEPEATALQQLDLGSFVEHLYRKGALNRDPEAAGRAYWTQRGQESGRAWLVSRLANQIEQLTS